MPLTDNEVNALMLKAAQSQGCPVTVKDRLDAFTEGMKAALRTAQGIVTLDKPELDEKEDG